MFEATAVLRAVAFFLAIFGALVALQLYRLIRAGELAGTWRPFIVGSLVLAVWSLTEVADLVLGEPAARPTTLTVDVLRAAFAALFAMGLWTQRQTFYHPERLRPGPEGEDGMDLDHDDTADEDDETLDEPRQMRAERAVWSDDDA
ncbi:MAG: hypothetical protein IT204_16220 [Fimbriimonadaceae bacterium]|nr:hypothetical protein [Fimbriimonadaceae bacterium]